MPKLPRDRPKYERGKYETQPDSFGVIFCIFLFGLFCFCAGVYALLTDGVGLFPLIVGIVIFWFLYTNRSKSK